MYIQCCDSNPQPLEREFSTITTTPGLAPARHSKNLILAFELEKFSNVIQFFSFFLVLCFHLNRRRLRRIIHGRVNSKE